MPRRRRIFPDGYLSVFPQRLRERMTEKGYTYLIIANALGISRQAVAQYCSGASQPSVETMASLVIVLDTTADWLIGLSNVKERNATSETLQNRILELENKLDFIRKALDD